MNIIHVNTPEQLEQCLNIRYKVFVDEQKVPSELEKDHLDASPAACCHILLLDGDFPAGTGRLYRYKENTAKLQRVAVLQAFRGRGLGRQIIAALEKQAMAHGMTDAILDAQCHALDFYLKLGYRVISDKPFDDAGIPHVRMMKKLK